ncbi:MAG TPA: biotin synthase BioB [Candidatus Hypogeohydataceae bacterium YC38]
MNANLRDLGEKVLEGQNITREEALLILGVEGQALYDLFYWANKIRHKYLGPDITCCAIVSAKQGRCSEDCRFCAQSAWFNTPVEEFSLIGQERLSSVVRDAQRRGANSLGVVTSGRELPEGELLHLSRMLRETEGPGSLHVHASLGLLSPEGACILKASGVKRFNHNLETSERYFPELCTTHSYADRVATIKAGKEAGLEVCSGGIFGVGELPEDRLELAFTLKELEVDTIPLNFLHPIPGTPLETSSPLSPIEILKIIALFRFILPRKEIKVAGGRQRNLRDLQSWVFYAGASSIIVGNYLTTKGRAVEEDLQMIIDLGLRPRDSL